MHSIELEYTKVCKLELGRRINEQRKQLHILHQLFGECTLKCNLKCLHCGSDCKVIDGKADMPLSDFYMSWIICVKILIQRVYLLLQQVANL